MVRDLFKDLTKYLPSFFVPGLIGIISVPIITRLISPEEYGNYALVLAAVAILTAFSTAWLSSSSVRFYPFYTLYNRLEEFYGVVVKLIFISVISIIIISLIISFIIRNFILANLYSLMYIGLFIFLVESFFEVFLDILRARRKVSWYSFFKIWRSAASFIFGIVLIITFHLGVKGLLVGIFLSIAIALPLLYKLAIVKPSFKKGNILSPMVAEIIKYGFPIIVINLASWIVMLSDRFILNFFKGSGEVGIYSIGCSISQRSILFIVTLFAMASSPIAFNIWEKQGVKASQTFLTKLIRYYLLFGFPATVGLSALSKPVMRVFAAPSYFLAYQVIPLISFSIFFIGIINIFNLVVTFYKKTYLIMFCSLFIAALNLGLNILLIPKYGYMAAALTTFIAFAIAVFIMIIISRNFLAWPFPFMSLVKIASASAVMGIAVHYVGNNLTTSNPVNLIVGLCMGTGVYFVTLMLLREFQPEETKAARTLASKIIRGRC